MSRSSRVRPALPTAVAAACLLLLNAPGVLAQSAATLPTVTVTSPPEGVARTRIGGLPETPSWATPQQGQVFGQEALREAQITRLADLTKLDASVADAYNAGGYWDQLSVRGFTLNNAYNYRREGLPINAETRLALDNKQAVELFKGTSGIQAGVSAPGGLVNLLVKRPQERVREISVGVNDQGGWLTSADLGDRFGERREFGLRLNLARESLRSAVDKSDGDRRLVALATDWRLSADTLLEAEFEHSFHEQPSIPGFSLLGGRLPSLREIDRNVNLNAQPWTGPVGLQGNTGSVGWKQQWQGGWTSKVTYGEQHLQSTDRAAFPFGCSAENDYTGYCSNGTFDLYDFRSFGESRVTRALNAQLNGSVQTGFVRHDLGFGVLRSEHDTKLRQSAYNYAGEGHVSGRFDVPPAATPLDYANSNRRERSTELSVVDALSHQGPWRAWVGMRHTLLDRDTALTDGSASSSLSQTVNTFWGALALQLAEKTQAYVSWGQGFEAYAVPTSPLPDFENAGSTLPVRKSRQWEAGVKGQFQNERWSVNGFAIHRPVAAPVTGASGNPSFVYDGEAVHKGLEAQWQGEQGPWRYGASAMVIDTERRGSARPGVNGNEALNVPEQSLKLTLGWRLPLALPAWVQADVVHEGPRTIEDVNRTRLSSWTRTDVSARAVQKLAGQQITWRLGVTNLFDVEKWREGALFSDHVYLFPLAQRSVQASATIDF